MSFSLLLLKRLCVVGPQALSCCFGISSHKSYNLSENLELLHVIDLFLISPLSATGHVFVEMLEFQCVWC